MFSQLPNWSNSHARVNETPLFGDYSSFFSDITVVSNFLKIFDQYHVLLSQMSVSEQD